MPAANIKNVTFALPVTMMDEIRQLAKKQRQSSINSLVREALEHYLEEKRREEIRQDMLEASRDPAAGPALHQFFGTTAFHRIDPASQRTLNRLRDGLKRVRLEVE